MFFYYLLFFCLLYDVLISGCEAFITTGHSTKERAISIGSTNEKSAGDWPEYIDEMRSLILFILFVLMLLIDAKPRPFDDTVRLIRVKRQWGSEWYRLYRPRWAKWTAGTGYRPWYLLPLTQDGPTIARQHSLL
ncbi:hypothetical protein OSTOST_05241, partial [Ostertagia ostertagi]